MSASHRDSVFESDALQGITVCNPMLYELLPQRGRHAGRAPVGADLGPGQALGQFTLGLGAGPGPREDGLTESSSSSSIPHRQDGRELRHLLWSEYRARSPASFSPLPSARCGAEDRWFRPEAACHARSQCACQHRPQETCFGGETTTTSRLGLS